MCRRMPLSAAFLALLVVFAGQACAYPLPAAGQAGANSDAGTQAWGTFFLQGAGAAPLTAGQIILAHAYSDPELSRTASSLERLHSSRAYFGAENSLAQFETLSKMFSSIEISLECPRQSGYFPYPCARKQGEDFLQCAGVSLENEFRKADGSDTRIKHTITLRNLTSETQKRSMSIMLSTDAAYLQSDTNTFTPSSEYQHVATKSGSMRFENSADADFNAFTLDFTVDASLRLLDSGKKQFGVYDWSDFEKSGFDADTVIYMRNGKAVMETMLEISLRPGETVFIDPSYDMNRSSDFNVRFDGGTASDQLGYTYGSGSGVQLVNADGGAYTNDLLLTAYLANVGQTDNGAVYLIKNIDGITSGTTKDLNTSSSWDVRFAGGATSDQLGYTENSGSGVQLVNADNGAYSNDLLLTAIYANVGTGQTDNGAVYLIKNIDGITSGTTKDLNTSSSWDVRFAGGATSDQLGYTENSGSGVQLVNADGGAYTNDLLLTAYAANVGQTDNGAVYLIKNIDGITSGSTSDLNTVSKFDVRFDGGTASDQLGYTYGSGSGVQLVNADNGAYTNDLLLTAYAANVGQTDNGAVYLIKNIDGITSGTTKDLNTSSSWDVRWDGGAATDELGYTGYYTGSSYTYGGGSGVQFINADNGAYTNDLLLAATLADVGQTNNGAVYLIKNIDGITSGTTKDLNTSSSWDVRWDGGTASEYLGNTRGDTAASGSSGVQFINADNGAYSNDLLLTAIIADVGSGQSNNGAVYLIRNIDGITSGSTRDLNKGTDFNVRWAGGVSNDNLGNTNNSGSGVQLVNADNGAYSNDLLLTAVYATVGQTNNGAVYLIKNIDGITSGSTSDLNTVSKFDVRFAGGATSDKLGCTENSGSGVQLVNADGGAYTNDLLLTAIYANVGQFDNGAAYLIRNIDGITSGSTRDLNKGTDFNVRWDGGTASEKLGYTNTSGSGVQLVNADGGAYTNDLLLTAYIADIGQTDNGAVYLIRNIDGITSGTTKDLNTSSDFNVRWDGGAASDQLGDTENSGSGVQLVNADNGAYTNDLLLAATLADVGQTDNGAVYLIRNVATAPNTAPDVNVTSPSDANYLSQYAGGYDHNVALVFSVQDADNGMLYADIYRSASAGAFTTAIINDLNLNDDANLPYLTCDDTTWTDATTCVFDWNVAGAADGNYFIDVNVFDTSDLNKVDSSNISFMIDNTKASTSWDGNTTWSKYDQNITLTCTDDDSGCASTKYRLDTNGASTVSYGSWQTYTAAGIQVTNDGNFALDFNSTDAAGNVGDVNTKYVLIDKNAPSVSITSPAGGATLASSSVTIEYSGTDTNSGIRAYYVKADSGNWSANGTNTSYTFAAQSNGQHTYYVLAQDMADNNSSDANVTVTVNASSTDSSGSSGVGKCAYREGTICAQGEACSGYWILSEDSTRCCSGTCSVSAGGGEGEGGGGGKPREAELRDIITVENAQQLLGYEGLPILDQTGSDVGLNAKKIATDNYLGFVRHLRVQSVWVASKAEKYRNTVTLILKNKSGRELRGIELFEAIPKTFVANASLIKSDSNFVVVEADPLLKFTIGELKAGESASSTYTFDSNLAMGPITEVQFAAVPVPVVLLDLEADDACMGVYCNDFDPCTRDYCKAGGCEFAPMADGAKCGNGMVCKGGECLAKGRKQQEPQEQGQAAAEPQEVQLSQAALVLAIAIMAAVMTYLSGRAKGAGLSARGKKGAEVHGKAARWAHPWRPKKD
ncbi:MAG: Ig-like domain-containing protein [Candidatus Diapherotrites archaeon]